MEHIQREKLKNALGLEMDDEASDDDSFESVVFDVPNTVCDHAVLPRTYNAVINRKTLRTALKKVNASQPNIRIVIQRLHRFQLRKCDILRLHVRAWLKNSPELSLEDEDSDDDYDECVASHISLRDTTIFQIKEFKPAYNRHAFKQTLHEMKFSRSAIKYICKEVDEAHIDKHSKRGMLKKMYGSLFGNMAALPEPTLPRRAKAQPQIVQQVPQQNVQRESKLETQDSPQQDLQRKPKPNVRDSPQRNPQQGPTLLNLYSNWDLFNRQNLLFVEGQRSLLSLCIKNLPLDSLNGMLELDLINQRLNENIVQKMKEMATQLEGVQNKILAQKLALQTEEIGQLQDEIEKLKLEASESAFNVVTSDQGELADRLEAQTACLKDKERRIAELQEILSAHMYKNDLTCNAVQDVAAASAEWSDQSDFHELSEQEVARLEPRALIGHIRRELGVGAEHLNAAQRRVFRAMRGKLGSALEKLAQDIYSNDSQIVLEIIQNADDNFYDGVQPHLGITVIADKYLWVTNNEVGFTNENVVAIANVGSSTKKDASRFTGHKGIGFKSVFKVTRTPYIISRDFCFRFNLDSEHTEENIGYILPEWVEKRDIEELVAPQRIDPDKTHFYFPFSQSTRFPAEELYDGIDFIPLFLRQLHTIELTLDDKKKVVTISKDGQRDPLQLLETLRLNVVEHTTSLDSGEVSQETLRAVVYRVYRKILDVPKDLQVSQVGRAPPTKTELILAFPMVDGRQLDQQLVEHQKVYSYLPVESAGFRFIIQADFHLVSSRDRVHTQDLFNRWLSLMVPVAFHEAFGLTEDPATKNSPLRDELFTFLPTREELARLGQSESSTDGFWRRVMKGILDCVMDTPCVLTETAKWAKPSDVRIRPKAYEDLFTNDELWTVHGKEFVCRRMTDVAVRGLGCQYLSPSEVVAILNHPEFSTKGKGPDWFCMLYRFFGSQPRGVGELLEGIFVAKMFPLASGAVSSLQEGRIFFWKSKPIFGIGENVLRLLALDLTSLAENDLAYRFLDQAGIAMATPLDVADSILVYHCRLPKPVSASPAASDLITEEQLWEQLRFLKEHLLDIGQVFPRIENGLLVPVQCPQSKITDLVSADVPLTHYHYAKFVYMPYLRDTFAEISPTLVESAVFLDDSFQPRVALQSEKAEWFQFLTVTLGVNRSLRLCETYHKVYEPSDELNFALNAANSEALLGSPKTSGLLLRHMQTNWKYFRQSISLIRAVRCAKSGYFNFPIASLLPALQEYKDLLLGSDNQPCLELPAVEGLTDEDMLQDLGIADHFTVAGLEKLEKLLRFPSSLTIEEPIVDLTVWKKVYAKMLKLGKRPDAILVCSSTAEATFVKCSKICLDLPPIFHDWVSLVPFPAADYAGVPGIQKCVKPALLWHDLAHVLFEVLKTEKPSKEEQKEVVLECFRRMDEILASKSINYQMSLVLERIYLLRGKKTAHLLVMPNSLHLYEKFVWDPKAFCPIKFVHPELAQLPSVARALVQSLSIPLLSDLVTVCPVSSTWRGYYVIPPGTNNIEVPTFLSCALTNLYRALLAEFLFRSSKSLKEEEKAALGNLMRATTVYVSAIELDQVPVAYTVYGISVSVLQNYYIHTTEDGQKQVIVPDSTLSQPLEQQVDLYALKDLFPALVIDDYLKSVIPQLIRGGLQLRLDSQYILKSDDGQKIFPFQIVVPDIEAVQKAQEYRKSSGGSTRMPQRRMYPIHRLAPCSADRRAIPGLIFQRPSASHQATSKKDTVPNMISRDDFPNGFKGRSGPVSLLSESRNAVCPNDTYKGEELFFYHSAFGSVESLQRNGTATRPDPASSKSGAAESMAPRTSVSSEPASATVAPKSSEPAPAIVAPRSSEPPLATKSSVANGLQPSLNSVLAAKSKPLIHNFADLQKLKNEIQSWQHRSVQEIEARLFGSGELEYHSFVQGASSSNSDLLLSLRLLENEGESAKWIGLWAEEIAYNHLGKLYRTRKPLLQGSRYVCHPPESFTAENWVSSARQHFEQRPCPCDDTKGYDFCYRQANGVIVYIEVKGHATYSNSFLLSSNEWEVARRVAGSSGEVYVILGINLNVLSLEGAHIMYLLENPIHLQECGAIIHRPLNYLVEVVSAVVPSAPQEQPVARSNSSESALSSNASSSSPQAVPEMKGPAASRSRSRTKKRSKRRAVSDSVKGAYS